MYSAYQPIYDSANGELLGHEAYLRPYLGEELISTSDFVFNYAEKAGKLVQFDRTSRALHVLNFKQIYGDTGLLFLSVHPNLLVTVNEHGKTFERILHAYSIPTSRVVIQIEEALIDEDKLVAEAIQNYRERGYLIAINNFGNKKSHIDRLWLFSPNFVKLDPQLISKAQSNLKVKQILPGLIKIIQDIGGEAIITGIENQAQLDIAIETGAKILQGPFLGEAVSAKDLQPNKLFSKPKLAIA
jgi:EAL domain-containing protein (putative c-di-GMP-specific phosphodiesterase class I)